MRMCRIAGDTVGKQAGRPGFGHAFKKSTGKRQPWAARVGDEPAIEAAPQALKNRNMRKSKHGLLLAKDDAVA